MSIEGGVTLGGIDKLRAEYMERLYESPLALYTNPFLRSGWMQVTAELRRKERKCQIEALRERITGARIMASKMPPGASPFDAMKIMWEVDEVIHSPRVDGVARRHMRETCYEVMMKEFIGRDVG